MFPAAEVVKQNAAGHVEHPKSAAAVVAAEAAAAVRSKARAILA